MEKPTLVKTAPGGGAAGATTFRVSEIPINVSKSQLIAEVGRVLLSSSDGNHDVAIVYCTLAPSPADQKRFQIATVTFGSVPHQLKPCLKGGQVQLEVTVGDIPAQISFDTHFIGITPLNDGLSGSTYSVE